MVRRRDCMRGVVESLERAAIPLPGWRFVLSSFPLFVDLCRSHSQSGIKSDTQITLGSEGGIKRQGGGRMRTPTAWAFIHGGPCPMRAVCSA